MREVKSFADKFVGKYLKVVGAKRINLPALPYSILIVGLVVIAVARFYYQQGEFEKTLTDLVTFPTHAEKYFKVAQEAAKQHDYDLAQQLYSQGLSLADEELVMGVASDVWRQIYPEESLKLEIFKWEKIIQKQPTYRDGLLKLVDLYQRLGDEEQAFKYLLMLKRIDPNNEIVGILEVSNEEMVEIE